MKRFAWLACLLLLSACSRHPSATRAVAGPTAPAAAAPTTSLEPQPAFPGTSPPGDGDVRTPPEPTGPYVAVSVVDDAGAVLNDVTFAYSVEYEAKFKERNRTWNLPTFGPCENLLLDVGTSVGMAGKISLVAHARGNYEPSSPLVLRADEIFRNPGSGSFDVLREHKFVVRRKQE